jgi:hypothetical protein
VHRVVVVYLTSQIDRLRWYLNIQTFNYLYKVYEIAKRKTLAPMGIGKRLDLTQQERFYVPLLGGRHKHEGS